MTEQVKELIKELIDWVEEYNYQYRTESSYDLLDYCDSKIREAGEQLMELGYEATGYYKHINGWSTNTYDKVIINGTEYPVR